VRAQANEKDINLTTPVALTTGTWLITGSATLESAGEDSRADCTVTVEIPGDKPRSYPIVFKSMTVGDIESFTAAVLVAVESPEPASATATCTGDKTNTKILNLTISAVEAERTKG